MKTLSASLATIATTSAAVSEKPAFASRCLYWRCGSCSIANAVGFVTWKCGNWGFGVTEAHDRLKYRLQKPRFFSDDPVGGFAFSFKSKYV
jgi:hypothetical protein